MNKFMKLAIKEAEKGISLNHGGPFGSVIVRGDKVVGKGHNHVVCNNDPTAHGEMYTIRKTCKKLKTFDLTGCDLYTTGEPCPMCLSACLWANINHIYYGCTIQDNDKIGFRDEIFYKYLDISTEKMKDKISQIDHKECLDLFEKYNNLQNKTMY